MAVPDKTETVRTEREPWHFPVAPEGLGLVAIPLAGLLLSSFWASVPFIIFFAVVFLFFIFFFRHPVRRLSLSDRAIVSPADGRIVEVGRAREDKHLKSETAWVAIFMSPFNVHVNRAPVAGRVVFREEAGEKYLAAYRPESATENVQVSLALRAGNGRELLLKQIVGVLARRIVCRPRVGDSLAQAEKFGLIRFGSRVELFLPEPVRVLVKPGDRVRGGQTVIGEW